MWIAMLVFGLASLAEGDLLYRVTSGGDDAHRAGLWGGDIELSGNGRTNNLFRFGFDTFNTSSGHLQRGMRIDYVTHDPVSMKALFIIEDTNAAEDSTQQAVAVGDLCSEGTDQLDVLLTSYKFVDTDNPHLLDSDCGWRCGWGPFAFTDNRLYFLFSAVLGSSFSNLRHEIQLRVLHQNTSNCLHAPDATGVSELSILQCSDHLQTIHSTQFVKPSADVYASTTTSLKVVTVDGRLHFFTQLIDTSDSANPSLALLHITPNNTFTISRSSIDVIFTGNLRIRGFAAVDFRQNVLCWSSADRLHCALYWLDGEEPHVAKVLEKGEATMRKICATGK